MKTVTQTLAIFILTIFTISCSNNDDNGTQLVPVAQTNFFNATIDGTLFTAGAINVLASNDATPTSRINVTCATSQGNFEFVLTNHVGVGNYTVGGVGGYNLIMRYGMPSSSSLYATNTCGEDEGTLTITRLTATEIEGTFSFVGKQSGNCGPSNGKNITNGSFKSGLIQ